MNATATQGLRHLPLDGLHRSLGARMGPFAGWDMPLHYGDGVIAEHEQTRSAASLFDVSHMGQVILRPHHGMERLRAAMEGLTPADLCGLPEGRQRYALLTDDAGGILDDLMITARPDHLFLVVNAATRNADIAHLSDALPGADIEEITDRALFALQGPQSAAALSALLPGIEAMRFMDAASFRWHDCEIWVSRSGYTGEDGFEISVPLAAAESLALALLSQPGVKPAGLAARDSLRLEAGLCLYGQDIDRSTSPVEAALEWSIGRSRRAGGPRHGGFPGADRILRQLEIGPRRRRVGLRPEGRQPMRAGTPVLAEAGPIGRVTSGGFGPTLGAPIAMAYVDIAFASPGTRLTGEVRGKTLPATVCSLPFVPPSFKR
ncbi:glycine cleavage system T protein [Rubellimicrobium thermophilum DSM 16684]|uniref:aminomethyltransferase n=1 Tax=Rubellimicrobium thermophilum DSM 16684 TaxID=1123069 RepID=S9SAG7_9RHOB|nr:glycine cleavage system aminomethyltransferase GcvT [Rubellimicrobium thermophilum]EPX87125.1 glycine cleavage system T protein [Rubellimicrobium thermophilum DSM 16684]